MAKQVLFFALLFSISLLTTATLLFSFHPQVFASIAPSPTPSPSPSPSPTPSPTPIPPTPTNTPTPTPRPTATPTPKPSPTPTSIPLTSADIESLFSKYAAKFSVSTDLLRHIANCESHFNTNSRNGDYGGMFQFSTSSWEVTRRAMSENTDPNLRFNAEEAIKTAAFKISLGQKNAWPSCQN